MVTFPRLRYRSLTVDRYLTKPKTVSHQLRDSGSDRGSTAGTAVVLFILYL